METFAGVNLRENSLVSGEEGSVVGFLHSVCEMCHTAQCSVSNPTLSELVSFPFGHQRAASYLYGMKTGLF